MIAIGAMILTPLADRMVPGAPSITYAAIAYFLLWLAAALTVYTGVIYFRSGMAHLRPGPTPEPNKGPSQLRETMN
jgi:phosphatidylglycerophosphate synthase